VPRALAGIVENSARLCAATAAPAAQRGRARSAAPARMGCTWRGSPQLACGALISAEDMAAVLAATGTCSPMRRSSAGACG